MLNNHKSIVGHENKVLLLSKLYSFFNFFGINELRVIVYHHVEKNKYDLFLKQLSLIKKNWNLPTVIMSNHPSIAIQNTHAKKIN